MQLMDQELLRLLREGKLSREEAYAKAASKKEFEAAPPPAASRGPRSCAAGPARRPARWRGSTRS
jgi:hypothetical protein